MIKKAAKTAVFEIHRIGCFTFIITLYIFNSYLKITRKNQKKNESLRERKEYSKFNLNHILLYSPLCIYTNNSKCDH